MNKDISGEELIDSVKEVEIKIRDHRADDDFERMLGELNKKREQMAAEKSAPKSAPEHTEIKEAPAAEIKPEEPVPVNETVPEPTPETEKVGERKAVPAMSAAIASAPPMAIPPRAEKRTPSQGAKKRTPQQVAKPHTENAPAKAAQTAEISKNKPAEAVQPPKPEAPKTNTAELSDLFGSNSEIWQNPNLSSGGRVSMNIKTELRKEIKITVPPEVLEREQARKDEELAEAARRDAAIRAEKQRRAESARNAKAAAARAAAKKKEAEKAEMTKKQFAIVNTIVCFTVFMSIGLFLLVCQRESGFIHSENRNLAEKPELTVSSLLDGSYFEEMTAWYTDTIPLREQLKPFASSFSKLFGVSFGDVKIKGDITPVKKEVFDENKLKQTEAVQINTDFDNTDATTKKKKKTETEELAEVPDNLDDGEWMGSVVVTGRGENVRAMSAFYGTFDMGQKYAETINKYRDDLSISVNVYTMNMPTSAAYYMPANLADDFTSQHDCILNIGSNLKGIVNVDVYSALEKHKNEYIYSRTDHHWAPLGAYYAAQVFAEQAKVDFPELSTYEEYRIENFVGTMYAYSNYDEELAANPDTFIYHKPDNYYTVNYYDSSFSNPYSGSLFFDYAEGINCYSAILGTDDIIAEIETDCDNGRTLVIFKDSFGNALVPYLTHSFSKIYVCDFRYFDINAIDFCEEVGCTDLLFAVSLSAAHTESHINAIGNDRIQIPESYLPETVIPDAVIPEEPDDEYGGYD